MTAATTRGQVVWVTGLSGSGKSTVAAKVAAALRETRPVVLLDGDELREVFPRGDAMGLEERRALAASYARLCLVLARQGLTVVIGTISMFDSVRAWNRATLPGYFEVFLDVPPDELERRDAKGLYARLRSGAARDVVGFDLPAEFPTSPDLHLRNHGALTADAAAAQILTALQPR